MRKALLFLLLYGSCSLLNAQYAGTWYGILEAGGQQIPLDLELTETADGYTGGLLSPLQSPQRVPFSSLRVAGDSLWAEVDFLSMNFVGSFQRDQLTGTFRQGTFSTALTFQAEATPAYQQLLDTEEKPARPQDPTEFPYLREAVTFPSGAEAVTMAGELTLPKDAPPKAAVILITGSGPQNRNQDLGPSINHRPFLVISDWLTRQGYAVLRYDDRGTGESTGDFSTATSEDFAVDAAGALRFLRQRFGGSAIPIGLAGHSEGGMIAPMVVAAGEAVDFLILLAAPGLSIDTLMVEQRKLINQSTPADEPVLSAVSTFVKAHRDMADEAFRSGLRDTIISVIPSLPDTLQVSIIDPAAFADTYVSGLASPWIRYFLAYEPTANLSEVKVPVLALSGERDTQVSPRNLDAIETTLKATGNPDVTAVLVPGANHLLQPAESGLPEEYGQIETTVDENVLTLISEWLEQRFN
ncbi:MAG: alpha/beta fold hydrolase [Lewinella sp.]